MFEVNVSNETASRTTLGSWREGTRVNLERSLSFGSELGGHLDHRPYRRARAHRGADARRR